MAVEGNLFGFIKHQRVMLVLVLGEFAVVVDFLIFDEFTLPVPLFVFSRHKFCCKLQAAKTFIYS